MKDISFEKAMEKLEKIVAELEGGDLSLDDSLKKYEEGVKLSKECRQKLDKAKQRIEVLKKNASGEFVKKDFKKTCRG
ncbi:MAG: exodeoxyribonuclease VII small subunit [Candidatus Omnitrophica bacterium]|nr:exodeoxyribonuclease VII small subunit [Candidatus Omnitrophota bacterium]MBU1128879.1 exodeoxyribonuclease VII small subunit [Candidatus Omnitrophota bacterium]MBU1784466.1 exodeoxyribonuclease VII small subunit [Candidatus Omnitrophota bacterium]MBU1851944.1 exodeoxyribonuclease VII small subunit [Candidatus Omnitrophota bacterium]